MIEESLLPARKNNYLMAIYAHNEHLIRENNYDELSPFSLAWTDLSTGIKIIILIIFS